MADAEKRLIDANAVYEMGHRTPFHIGIADLCDLKELLTDVPTVDAVEVVHGEWSTIEDDYIGMVALQCSECNQEYWFEDEPPKEIYNYCPNCGVKMDRGQDNNLLFADMEEIIDATD